MSYDIRLKDPITGGTLLTEFPHQITGGTYAMGGTTELWLNVTYNYAKHYYRTIDQEKGIRAIYGLSGAQSIPLLQKGIDALGDDTNEDYWQPTEGNAKQALYGLLAFAQLRPDGVWHGD